MSDLDLDEPAQISWLAPDEPTRHETGDPGTRRSFNSLRDAVVFALEGLPERYRESVRIEPSRGASLDIGQARRIYSEIVKP